MTVTSSLPVPGRLAANLICMASMMIWAAGLPAAEVLIPLAPPIALAAMRLTLAAAFLLPIWWAVEGWQALRRADWPRGIFIGGVCLGLGAGLLIYGQSKTDAVTVAVISAMAPVVGIALECAQDGRRLSARLVIGLALTLAGGLASYAAAMGSLALGLGALAALGSVFCYTWGSRATVGGLPGLSPLGRTAITVTGAALLTTLAALVQLGFGGRSPDFGAFGVPHLLALAIYGIGSIAISQLLWIMSVGRLGIGMSSLHLNATPFYVMLILFALGQPWNGYQAIGALVVGLGVLIAQGLLPPQRGAQ